MENLQRIYYTFLHQGKHVPFYKLDIESGLTWDFVRYKIEQLNGMQFTEETKKCDSYIIGWLYDENLNLYNIHQTPFLRGTYLVNPEDKFILCRKQLKKGWLPYVPKQQQPQCVNTINEQKDRSKMTEEEIIDYMIKETENKFKKGNQYRTRQLKPPPNDYVCLRCGKGGHWKQYCPTWDDPDFVPIKIRKPPTGIPKKFLLKAMTDEQKKNALITSTGELVYIRMCDQNLMNPDTNGYDTAAAKKRRVQFYMGDSDREDDGGDNFSDQSN